MQATTLLIRCTAHRSLSLLLSLGVINALGSLQTWVRELKPSIRVLGQAHALVHSLHKQVIRLGSVKSKRLFTRRLMFPSYLGRGKSVFFSGEEGAF